MTEALAAKPRLAPIEDTPTTVGARGLGPGLWGLLAGLLVWEVAGQVSHSLFLPPFSAVLWAALQLILKGQILLDLMESLKGLLIGFGLAAVVGVVLGALMGRYRKVEYFLDIYLNVLLSSPTLIYVPVLFAFFGISRASQIALVFLYAAPVIIVNTMIGLRSVKSEQVELARSLGASEWQLFWVVLFPSALPLTLLGLRTGATRAVKGMIDGEMVIALVGLGAALTRYGGRFEIDKLMAVLLMVIVVALVVTSLVQLFERRATAWLINRT